MVILSDDTVSEIIKVCHPDLFDIFKKLLVQRNRTSNVDLDVMRNMNREHQTLADYQQCTQAPTIVSGSIPPVPYERQYAVLAMDQSTFRPPSSTHSADVIGNPFRFQPQQYANSEVFNPFTQPHKTAVLPPQIDAMSSVSQQRPMSTHSSNHNYPQHNAKQEMDEDGDSEMKVSQTSQPPQPVQPPPLTEQQRERIHRLQANNRYHAPSESTGFSQNTADRQARERSNVFMMHCARAHNRSADDMHFQFEAKQSGLVSEDEFKQNREQRLERFGNDIQEVMRNRRDFGPRQETPLQEAMRVSQQRLIDEQARRIASGRQRVERKEREPEPEDEATVSEQPRRHDEISEPDSTSQFDAFVEQLKTSRGIDMDTDLLGDMIKVIEQYVRRPNWTFQANAYDTEQATIQIKWWELVPLIQAQIGKTIKRPQLWKVMKALASDEEGNKYKHWSLKYRR